MRYQLQQSGVVPCIRQPCMSDSYRRKTLEGIPHDALSSSVSVRLTDYAQVDMLDLRYKLLNFGKERARAHQIREPAQTVIELATQDFELT